MTNEVVAWPESTSASVLAYFAGLVDGEGHVILIHHAAIEGHRKRKYEYWQPRVGISNTNSALIDWLKAHYPNSCVSICRNKRENQKDAYTWCPRTASIAAFLEALLPFLVIKRRQAELVLAYCHTHKATGCRGHSPETVSYRRQLSTELRALNRRGRTADAA